MHRFGFVSHYLSLAPLLNRFRWLRACRVPPRLLEQLLPLVPPYPHLWIRPVVSPSGAQVEGIGVACPLVPKQFVSLKSKQVLSTIIRAVRIAEHFGARLVGLGGLTSVIGNEGEEVRRHVNVAVTSGNTYTAALTVQGLLKAAALMGLEPEECTLTIIGASGDIGSACARALVGRVGVLRLVARREQPLVDLARTLEAAGHTKVVVMRYTQDAVRGADIVLTATNALTTLIDPTELEPRAVVCDVAYPANIPQDLWKYRDDVLAFEGGLATWSGYGLLEHPERLEHFSPPTTLHGCLAETMVLSLSEHFTDFSLGRGRITEDAMQQIASLAIKHGFRLAPFHCGRHRYAEEELIAIRRRAVAARSRQAVFV